MIKLQNYAIPTNLSEINLEQWIKISKIIQEESNNWIAKYFTILEILNVPDNVLDAITDAELFEWITEFNNNSESDLTVIKSITINDEVFNAYQGDKFDLKARDILYIESEIAAAANILRIAAIIFKSNDPNIKSHYSDEEITRKAALFATQSADYFVGCLAKATDGLVNKMMAVYGK
jgi:hypothetical protein